MVLHSRKLCFDQRADFEAGLRPAEFVAAQEAVRSQLDLVSRLQNLPAAGGGFEVGDQPAARLVEHQVNDADQRQAEFFTRIGIDQRGRDGRLDRQRSRFVHWDLG